ncbi:MAG: hypothetical protein PHV36_14260 [Elusimicrobiales bacterium]|nr:hypothetical protein [Elusimicrobiales bacterium]
MNQSDFSLKGFFLLLYYWLCLGFFLGTLTLMGPVRWLANFSRANGWSDPGEKALVFLFIGILIVVSFLCARLFSRITASTGGKIGKAGLPAGSLLVFAVSLWFWMNPKLMIDGGMKESSASSAGIEFVFGPYPDEAKLAELRKEGYTAVISLLSPAVVPFEPALISREEAAAKEAGIALIGIPMLPWVSDNNQVGDRLKELMDKGAGRYYVHCYLGKDRVNVFKKILGSVSKDVKLTSLQAESLRTLYDIKKFERGGISVLAENVFFIPYPTDEEFFGYILNGSVKTVVSLLDPEDKEDLPWITKERTIAAQHKLALVNYSWKTLSKAGKNEAMKELMKLERPIAIHAFNSSAPECSDFIESYGRAKAGKN